MTASKIEWTDKVWNPVRGCSRVSEGCRNCYAERQAARFSNLGQPFNGFAKPYSRNGSSRWTGRVELVPDALDKPLRWRKPARVFVNSRSDLFHEALPDEAIDRVFAVMALAPQHTFQVLTKRPERMRAYITTPMEAGRFVRFMEFVASLRPGTLIGKDTFSFRVEGGAIRLSNVWLGVSVEDQASADARIPILLDTPAAVRWVSAEPLLSDLSFRIPFARFAPPGCFWTGVDGIHVDTLRGAGGEPPIPALDWIVVGGESGPGARPCDVAWIRSALEQCKAARVPCFVKQLGARPFATGRGLLDDDDADAIDVCPLRLSHPKGGNMEEWPEDLRVREFPQ